MSTKGAHRVTSDGAAVSGDREIKLPSPRARAAVEVAIIAVAAAGFLAAAPHESVLFITMALLALVFVATQATDIRLRFWPRPVGSRALRLRRAVRLMVMLTAPALAGFLLVAVHRGHTLLTAGFGASLALYVPWAIVQQTLFQFYLHGRFRALLSSSSSLAACVATGACYGLVHLPNVEVVALTTGAGVIWSYCYERDRLLLPIAASHALLGATFYAWVEGRDALAAVLRAFGA